MPKQKSPLSNAMAKPRLHIDIDTREQQPWNFGEYADISRRTINAGDYAVHGDCGFAIERKSLDDYARTVSVDYVRFRAELNRMTVSGFPARIIIVESDWSAIIAHNYNSPEIQPALILRRTAELLMDGVAVVFCSDPASAAGLCWRTLYERKKRLMENADNNDN